MYLPTNPEYHITDVIIDSAAAMQSAGKAPYRLMFEVEPWDGPDSAIRRIEHNLDEQDEQDEQPVIQRRPSSRCRLNRRILSRSLC